MPLGNLTSQFFANVYLNELDQFIKHKLKVKYYLRYVDDFIILDNSRDKLEKIKIIVNNFLKENLKINLHPNKSRVIKIERGVSFLGFRIFYYHKLIRRSNLGNFDKRFNQMKYLFDEGFLIREKALGKLNGWIAYARHGNTYKYRKHLIKDFNKSFSYVKGNGIRNKKKFKSFIKKVDESKLEFSTQKTLLFFLKGMSIKEISKYRNLKEDTIWTHLENLIEHKQISLNKVLSVDKIYKIITKICSKNDKLKDIKKRIKDKTITYNDIACVRASIKSKKKNSPS